MTEIPITEVNGDNKYLNDCHTPNFSDLSSDEEYLNIINEPQYQQEEEIQQPIFTNDFINTSCENENQIQQGYFDTTNEGLDGKEIKNIIAEMFPESFKENTEIDSLNDDFTINHFKSFLKNIYTQFNELKESKQQEKPKKTESKNQLQKLKRQLNEKEDYRQEFEKLQKQLQEKEQNIKQNIKQIKDTQETLEQCKSKITKKHRQHIMNLQWILKKGRKEIMEGISEEIVDGNKNTDFDDQLKDFIDYCKDKIFHFVSQQNQIDKTRKSSNETNSTKEINRFRMEIQIRDDSIKKSLTKDNENKSKEAVKENEQSKQIIDNVKDEEIKKLKQIIIDIIEQNNQNINIKEKEIEEINVEKVKGSCEEEKVGEMIKTLTQRKLLTFTNELTKSRHSSQLSQQLILNSSSFIIPITIFEFYNGCSKMITIPINEKNVLKEVIIDKCDNHLIRNIIGITIIIEVQQHDHIAYDRMNEIAIFMIKRSEINQDIQIRHPCGWILGTPKEGLYNSKYRASDGTEIEIRIVEDNKFSEEMKRYYDILNCINQQKCITFKKIIEKIEKRDVVAKQGKQQKVKQPSKQIPKQPESKIQAFKQQPIEEKPSTKKLINQQQIEEIKRMQPRKIPVNLNATLYVSFVQSYIHLYQNIFLYKKFPVITQKGKEMKHKVLEVEIPINYDKDVYYCEYVNRKELFSEIEKEFSKIPIYFPIPVLRHMKQYTVIFHILSTRNKFCYIKLNVTIES
ncbi:hypothetical protein QTN25_002216 [Entamoeba marina]